MTERLSDRQVWLVTALCPSCEWESEPTRAHHEGNPNRLWQARRAAARLFREHYDSHRPNPDYRYAKTTEADDE